MTILLMFACLFVVNVCMYHQYIIICLVYTLFTTIYLFRYYVDSGCVFVGHGLTKDFETANIFVPPHQVHNLSVHDMCLFSWLLFVRPVLHVFYDEYRQIRDTVELWRLPNQRKISLRFLAAYLLRAEIQDELHDSIEDAKTVRVGEDKGM